MHHPEPKLEPQVVWNDAGHLGEPALHALADGELSCLPETASLHAEQCAECAARVGAIAMFALEVDAAVRALPLMAAVKARRALPIVPVLTALIVAGCASLPGLSALSSQLAQMPSRSLFSVCAQVLAHLISRDGGARFSACVSLAAWSSALLLLAASAFFARGVHASKLTAGGRS